MINKKIFKFFLIVLLLFPGLAFSKIKVVASLPIFASLAKEIGGEKVHVDTLARSDMDPHYIDAKPTFVAKISRADVLIYGGLGLESGWLPPLIQQSGNKKILPGNLGHVDISSGIKILEVPGANLSRAYGDIHPEGNPHIWIDPENLRKMALHLKVVFTELDRNNLSYYYEQYQNYDKLLDEKMADLSKKIKKLKNKKIISYHKNFVYFADWANMEIVDTIEPKPGIPPSSRRIPDLLKVIKQQDVDVILTADYYPQKISQRLSEQAKIPLVKIPLNTNKEFRTSIQWIENLINQIGDSI